MFNDTETMNDYKNKTKEELISEIKKYKTLFENNQYCYQSLDKEGKILYVSPAWLNTLGYKKHEVTGRFIGDFIHPDYLSVLEEKLKKLLKQGFIHKVLFKMKHKSGKYIFIFNDGYTTYSDKGEIIQIHCTFKDITKEYEFQKKVSLSESSYNALINNFEDSIWMLDKDFNYLIFNDSFAKAYFNIFKVNLKKGMNALKILSPKQRKFWKLRYKKVISGEKLDFEFSIDINGKYKYFEVRLNPLIFKNEITGITALSTNITKQKETESKLKESKEQYHKLIETVPLGIAVHQNNKIVYVNSAGKNIIGAKSDKEIINKSIKDFLPKENLKKILTQITETLKSNKYSGPVEEKYFKTDGSLIDIEVIAVPIKFKNKPAVQILVSDITERKKYQKELLNYRNNLERAVEEKTETIKEKAEKLEKSQQAMRFMLEDINETRKELIILNKKLENTNKDLESFAYSISHDLKSPLRAINGYMNILLEDFSEDFTGKKKEYMDSVIKNSVKMNTLIDDLLHFSRVGRNELNKSHFNLSRLVNDVINSISEYYGSYRIHANVQKNVMINADISAIKQVLTNLIGNAIKFSKNKNAEIEFGTVIKNQKNIYYIKDKGIGFEANYKDKIFDVFQRINGDLEVEGTGIGLAIVKRIITKHQGSIWAESEPDKGSTFYFTVS